MGADKGALGEEISDQKERTCPLGEGLSTPGEEACTLREGLSHGSERTNPSREGSYPRGRVPRPRALSSQTSRTPKRTLRPPPNRPRGYAEGTDRPLDPLHKKGVGAMTTAFTGRATSAERRIYRS